ncbi:hypothetical protein ACFSCX_06795 [Bacillus salitolerans]|uniref:GapA-binding peptide SR1P n=1 Tax=Bacillus salitolerans TaxID=1437434 RepID=A0ABW4LP20_9BACI
MAFKLICEVCNKESKLDIEHEGISKGGIYENGEVLLSLGDFEIDSVSCVCGNSIEKDSK